MDTVTQYCRIIFYYSTQNKNNISVRVSLRTTKGKALDIKTFPLSATSAEGKKNNLAWFVFAFRSGLKSRLARAEVSHLRSAPVLPGKSQVVLSFCDTFPSAAARLFPCFSISSGFRNTGLLQITFTYRSFPQCTVKTTQCWLDYYCSLIKHVTQNRAVKCSPTTFDLLFGRMPDLACSKVIPTVLHDQKQKKKEKKEHSSEPQSFFELRMWSWCLTWAYKLHLSGDRADL